MTRRRIGWLGWLGIALAVIVAGRAPAAETARQILDRLKALEDGERHWNDRAEKMRFDIFDQRGGERVRELVAYQRREPGDERKSIVFFETPAEVKGTGFLSFTHKGRPADQWLYLPELKRVRQITARARTESFVGTDLSYQDLDILSEMGSWTEADARSSLLREEATDGAATWVIQLEPQREDIGYKKILLWLRKDDLVGAQLEFFGEAAEPVKRIRQRDIRKIGPTPVAHHIEVETPAKGSHTVIESSDVAFNQQLGDDLFTQRALERGER